jgi:hypothetical protein
MDRRLQDSRGHPQRTVNGKDWQSRESKESLVNRTTVTFTYYSVEHNILLVKPTFAGYSKKFSTILRIPNAIHRIHKNSPLDDTVNKANLMRTHLRHII